MEANTEIIVALQVAATFLLLLVLALLAAMNRKIRCVVRLIRGLRDNEPDDRDAISGRINLGEPKD